MNTKHGFACTAIAAIAWLAPETHAQDWSDDFESYSNGQVLYNVGGWSAWDDDPNVAGSATNAQAHSGTKSIRIENADDAIYTFDGYTEGSGVMSAWVYIPVSEFFADFFYLVQNDYQHGGPYEWCIDIVFDFDGDGGQGPGTVVDAFRPETQRVEIQFDTWVEIRCEIDIDNDTIVQYYGGQEIARGQLFIRGGTPQIKNLDLFTLGTGGFFDDTTATGFGGGNEYSLSVTGSCPGTVTVAWDNAGAGQQGLVIGNNLGSTTIPGTQPCAGTVLGIAGNVMLVDPPGIFGTQGGAGSFNGNCPGAASGKRLQLVKGGSCVTSNVAQLP